MMNKIYLTYVKEKKIRKTMKSMPHVKNRSDVLMWRKHRSIWSCCQITVSIFMLSSCISQASLDLLSQRASDCPSQLGQTTCTLLWNTPSRCCGPSQSACGCDPQREESGRLCLTLFLHNPMNWCCCKACIPPLSCSSMTRSVKLHRNWPVHCLGAIDLPKEVYVMLYGYIPSIITAHCCKYMFCRTLF